MEISPKYNIDDFFVMESTLLSATSLITFEDSITSKFQSKFIESNNILSLSEALVWLDSGVVVVCGDRRQAFTGPCWISLRGKGEIFSLQGSQLFYLDNIHELRGSEEDTKKILFLEKYSVVVNYCLSWVKYGLSLRSLSSLVQRIQPLSEIPVGVEGMMFELSTSISDDLVVTTCVAQPYDEKTSKSYLFLACDTNRPGLFESLICQLHRPVNQSQALEMVLIKKQDQQEQAIVDNESYEEKDNPRWIHPFFILGYILLSVATIVIYLFQARMHQNLWRLNQVLLITIILFLLSYISFRYYHFQYVLNYFTGFLKRLSLSSIKSSIYFLLRNKVSVDEAVARVLSFQHFGKSYFGQRDLIYPTWIVGFALSQLTMFYILGFKAMPLVLLNLTWPVLSLYLFSKIVRYASKVKENKKKIDFIIHLESPSSKLIDQWLESKKVLGGWENIFFSFQNHLMLFGNLMFLIFILQSYESFPPMNVVILEQFSLMAVVNISRRLNFLGNFMVELREFMNLKNAPFQIDTTPLKPEQVDKICFSWSLNSSESSITLENKKNYYFMGRDFGDILELLRNISGISYNQKFKCFLLDKELTVEELLPMVAYFSSDLRLLKLTVKDNIFMHESLPNELVQEIFQILKLEQLLQDERLSLNQVVGPDFPLSTKLIRHILLARTLLAPNRMICFLNGIGDWMDQETWNAILAWAKTHSKVIMAAGPSFHLAEGMDEIIFVEDHQILSRGPLSSLLMEGGSVRQSWQEYFGH